MGYLYRGLINSMLGGLREPMERYASLSILVHLREVNPGTKLHRFMVSSSGLFQTNMTTTEGTESNTR